jgi:hypothetical protein
VIAISSENAEPLTENAERSALQHRFRGGDRGLRLEEINGVKAYKTEGICVSGFETGAGERQA